MQDLVVTRPRAREDEFDDLIGPHLEAGYRTALAILHSPDEAHDVVQESAFKAWRRMGQLRDATSARSWFLAIVANQCRSVRRTRWFRTVRLPAFFQPSVAITELDRIDIERALAGLSMGDRQILFMHYYLDLPIEEIGIALGISRAAAKGRIYRACHRLRPGLLEEDI